MTADLYDKEVKCPVCDAVFTTKKVKTSAIRVDKRDTDFCAHYKGENPTFYGVIVCPKCGYSSFETDYLKVSNAQIAQVRAKVLANWGGKDYGGKRLLPDAIEAHKMAILNFNVMGYRKTAIAKACLRIAWFYRMQGDVEKELQFLQHALSNYETAYSTENIEEDPDGEAVILYLMGELNRMLGKYSASVRWFDMALKHPDLQEMKNVITMAKDQRYAASEAFRKEKEAMKNGNA